MRASGGGNEKSEGAGEPSGAGRGGGGAVEGMVEAERWTVVGSKADGCGKGEPSDAHRRLTMSAMREMLLLAEQMNLGACSRGPSV